MHIIPMVVTVGLLVSLVEAFWILPAHVISSSGKVLSPEIERRHWRARWTRYVRERYTRLLIYVFRKPLRFFAAGTVAFLLSVAGIATDRKSVV